MADDLPLPIDRLPTLTEVLELDRELPPTVAPPAGFMAAPNPAVFSPPVLQESVAETDALPMAAPVAAPQRLDEQVLVDRVLAQLMPRIDVLLEARVSEALAPALAQAADTLIRESREELLRALRGLAEESLAQVLRQAGSTGGREHTRG